MNKTQDGGLPKTAAVFFEQVAQHILTQHESDIPDLRLAVVLLPNYHSMQPLAQNLVRAANLPALLLPQMVTLSDWAQSIPLIKKITPDNCRIASLYQALRARNWFQNADLWGIARELLLLLDELTQQQITLPQSEQDFLAQLERAYQAKRNSAMQFEARVVHELWYAMSADGALDRTRTYQQRLTQLAQQAGKPLTVLLTSDLPTMETRFLEAYRARAPVTVFDIREMVARQPECAVIHSLSSTLLSPLSPSPSPASGRGEFDSLSRSRERVGVRGGRPSLRDQATHLRQYNPHAALNQRLHLFGAHGLEQEARAADVQIRRWLLAGKKSIAIVAQDRLVARRVRALLERAEVLVHDETGWTLSTLSVSTVLMRWLDALQSDFYHLDLLDLLKSPFIFADQPAHERKQVVHLLEQLLRKHSVVAHLDAYFDLAYGQDEVLRVLARLRQAADAMRKSSETLSGWLRALHVSLSVLGILPGLAADEAGQQLLSAVQTWEHELAGDTTRFSRNEWRHWLAQQLDGNTFHDDAIDSPVLFTHLAATRWRHFDAVLLLGCDASHLPNADSGSMCFNDAVRSTLGLPTREVKLAQQRDDLLGLLTMNDSVLVTWQASKNGEQNLLSPYFEMLRALHELAYGDDLAGSEDRGQKTEDRRQRTEDRGQKTEVRRQRTEDRGQKTEVSASCGITSSTFKNCRAAATKPLSSVLCPLSSEMPAPSVTNNLLPQRISASGYNSLVACPYQYYARHILRLNELDEVREGIEKRDYGQWVHDILHRFHTQHPVLSQFARNDLDTALQRISTEVFTPALQTDYQARAWLLLWQQAIPAYLDQQLKNEGEGWRFQNGEVPFELPLTDDLILHGRIDRVDAKDKQTRVLDYKMMDATRLRNKLKEAGEDVQLACYAAVYEADEAAFISIEKDKVTFVAPPQDVAGLAQANITRLLTVFDQMRNNAVLPAHGVDEACVYCEMRGLCRKSEWSAA